MRIYQELRRSLAIDEFSLEGLSSDSAHGHPEFQVTVIQVLVGTTELNIKYHEEMGVSLSNYGCLVHNYEKLRRQCAQLFEITDAMLVCNFSHPARCPQHGHV